MYQSGETIRLKAAVTDSAGAAAAPAIMKITINKPDGSVGQASANMEASEMGVFYYDYSTPINIEGTYSWKVTATGLGGRITITRSSFVVERSI